jgi:tetratricopeptide (TPR) repeat protein
MKQRKYFVLFITVITAFLFIGSFAEAGLQKGEPSPVFSELTAMQKKPMVLLYFFQLNSKPSVAGFEHLRELYQEYEKAGIGILAISKDNLSALNQYFEKNPVPFKIIPDDGTVFGQYGVKIILPVTYILGTGGRVSDRFEGGGASSYQMMTTVAQHSLDLKKTQFARAVYAKVLKSDPENITAKAGIANAYFNEGKLDQAKEEYTRIALLTSPDAILGKEGLVKTYLKEGDKEKALQIATQIKSERPENGLVYLIKGNILAEKGNPEEALAQYAKATDGKMNADSQTAEAYNNAGRIYSEQGEYALAEKMYQNAVVYNPFSAEILTNRGVLYEKQGQPQKAKALYEDALSADPEDAIAKSLGKRIDAHLNFQEDMEKQKRIDTLVTDLSAQYQKIKEGKQAPPDAATDPWSSRPLTLAFFGIKTTGGVREGITDAIQHEITQNILEVALPLNGRVQVVDREIMDKLLAELKLGSSDLADPETALRLGKLLSARLMITGHLYMVDEGLRLNLRLIDPETSAIKTVYASEKETTLTDLSSKTALTLNQRIIALYPLQGKIASVEGPNQVIINLGTRHGVNKGMNLKIIEEGEPIVLNGKMLGLKKRGIGAVEITNVEEGMSYAKIVEGQGLAKKGLKVVEAMNNE